MFPDSDVNTVSQNVEQKPGVSEKYRTGYNDSSSNVKDKNYLKILEGLTEYKYNSSLNLLAKLILTF